MTAAAAYLISLIAYLSGRCIAVCKTERMG